MHDPNFADDFGLDGPDPATTGALEQLGYSLVPVPGTRSSLIGEGTFADVFCIRHDSGWRGVAKVFKDLDDADSYFDNETSALEHPAFPKEFALVSRGSHRLPGARPFIVLEFLRGTPIDKHVTARDLTTAQRVELIEKAARGLAALHKSGITHRDIHAGNLVVTESGVRLIDFGLAGTVDPRTATITALGNRDCSPPEVWHTDPKKRKRPDERDDVYSLGALAIQILTDAKLPPNEAGISGDPAHLSRCRNQLRERGIDVALQDVLLACLKAHADRTVLAGTLAEQLYDWRVLRPQREVADRQRREAERLRRRQTAWVVSLSAVFLAIVAGLAWHNHQRLVRRGVDILRAEVAQLPNAEHSAVRKLVQEAADKTPAEAQDLLRRALRIGQALDGTQKRREALGVALNDTAWTQLDAITDRRTELGQLYERARTELKSGAADAAGRTLDELQLGLAELSKDNVAAATVAVARQQFERIAKLVPERLRKEQPADVARHEQRAQDALATARKRKWSDATLDLGQARQQLIDWLKQAMTPAELTAFDQADDEQLKLLEQESQRLKSELAKSEEQRAKEETKRREYEGRISDITARASDDHKARVQSEAQTATLAAQLKTETATRTTAETKVAQQETQIAGLQQAKKDVDSKLAIAQPLADQLPGIEADLKTSRSDLATALGRVKQLDDGVAELKKSQELLRKVADDAIARTKEEKKRLFNDALIAEGRADEILAQPTKPVSVVVPGKATLRTWRDKSGLEWVDVPAGEFLQGATNNESGDSDEFPQHRVRITQLKAVSRGHMNQAAFQTLMGFNPSNFKKTGTEAAEYPVETVTWFDSVECCNRLSKANGWAPYYRLSNVKKDGDQITAADVAVLGGTGARLLTEAETEYVIRAGTTTVFPWGNSLSSTQANFDGNHPFGGAAKGPYLQRTSKIGSYPANAWGVCDPVGQLWSWCWDVYDADYYKQFANQLATDPQGPSGASSSASRVLRGGGWFNFGVLCRSANRYGIGPGNRGGSCGFRVATGQRE